MTFFQSNVYINYSRQKIHPVHCWLTFKHRNVNGLLVIHSYCQDKVLSLPKDICSVCLFNCTLLHNKQTYRKCFNFLVFFSNKSFGHLVCVSLIVAPSSCCQFHDFFLLIHQPHLGSGSYFFGLKKIKLNLVLSSC